MSDSNFQTYAGGITCIDADYVMPGVACFYLLEEAGQFAVIETGTSRSAQRLFELLAQRGIAHDQVRYVIPTHVHLDHAGGAGAMMAAFSKAQLLIHPRGARHMIQPEKLIGSAMSVYGEEAFAKLYGEILPVSAERVREMADGDSVSLAGRPLQFRHTRGHANHHFCVWDEATRSWFTGDMFGVCYPWWRFAVDDFVLPSTTPTQFDPEAYFESLELLDSYQPQHLLLTHYGQIDYSKEKSQRLAQQVADYRDIAIRNADSPEQLQSLLTEHGLLQLQQFDPTGDEEQHRRWLSFDMPLNAQGLQIWQADYSLQVKNQPL